MNNITVTEKEMNQLVKQLAYRKAYNARPEVKARRAEYMKKRAERMKEAMKLFKEAQTNPELAVKLGLGTRVEL